MAFLENGVALFLTATYFCALQHQEKTRKWLYTAAVTAVLSTLSKINGIIAPFFFLAYVLKNHALKKRSKWFKRCI